MSAGGRWTHTHTWATSTMRKKHRYSRRYIWPNFGQGHRGLKSCRLECLVSTKHYLGFDPGGHKRGTGVALFTIDAKERYCLTVLGSKRDRKIAASMGR